MIKITNLKALLNCLKEWTCSQDDTDNFEICVPISVINDFRHLCYQEEYIEVLKCEVSRKQQLIKNQEIVLQKLFQDGKQ